MINSRPKVSVCIPTHNRAAYLSEAIQSVLDQTFADFELVIVDDASEDNTPEIVRCVEDRRIRYYRNVKNLGTAQNFNRCVELARGEYITIFNDDDLMLPENLFMKVKALENHNVDLVYCAMRVIDAKGNQMYIHRHYPDTRYLPGREQIIQCLKGGNCIGSPSLVAIKTSAFERVGKFIETLFQTDTEMWLRILVKGDAYFLADPLVSVRQHEASNTKRLERERQYETERLKFVLCYFQNDQIRALLDDYPEVKQFSVWLLGWFNYQLFNLKEARKWLVQAMLIRPLSVYSVKASIVWLLSFLGRSVTKNIVLLYHSFLNPATKRLRVFSRYLRGAKERTCD